MLVLLLKSAAFDVLSQSVFLGETVRLEYFDEISKDLLELLLEILLLYRSLLDSYMWLSSSDDS